MADGFDIHLNEDQARRLKAAADAAGMSLTDFALDILDSAITADLAEDERRWAEYRRTGESLSVQESFAAYDDEVRRRLADHDANGQGLSVDEWMAELRKATAAKRLARG